MTAERSTGLILRTRPLTETSLIVHWITPDAGRLATVAKGARRPKSPFRGKLDLFYLADFSYHRSRRSDLHTLREVSLVTTHPHLREDYARLRQASYCALLVEQVTESETPLGRSYDLLRDLVRCLEDDAARPEYVLAFELLLLAENGLCPDLQATRLTPPARDQAEKFLATDLAVGGQACPTTAVLAELQRFLHGFLAHHLDRIPHGREGAIGPLPSRSQRP